MNYPLSLVKKYRTITLLVSGLTTLSAGLLVFRYLYSGTTFNGSVYFGFLIWNLFLATLPLFFAILTNEVKGRLAPLALGLIALAFLPNSFYILTDFIHLNPAQAGAENLGTGFSGLFNKFYIGPGILFDAIMLFVFAGSACLFGVLSIDILKSKIACYASKSLTWLIVVIGVFLSSFAIYIGRVLRWNTWDFFSSPTDLFMGIVNIFTSPVENAQAWGMTALFFIVTTGVYGTFRLVRRL